MLELVAFTRFFERLPFLLETRGFPTLQRACPAQLLVREKKLQACPLPPIPFRFYTNENANQNLPGLASARAQAADVSNDKEVVITCRVDRNLVLVVLREHHIAGLAREAECNRVHFDRRRTIFTGFEDRRYLTFTPMSQHRDEVSPGGRVRIANDIVDLHDAIVIFSASEITMVGHPMHAHQVDFQDAKLRFRVLTSVPACTGRH